MKGLEQTLVQQIVSAFEKAYLTYICNRTTNSINNTVEEMLTHLQNNYGQFMTHKLLERKRIVKKTTYHPQDPIASVLSADEELLKFADITRTSYTQDQVVNISYVILHRTVKFGLAICKWNHTTTVQKTWVKFKLFFTAHQ